MARNVDTSSVHTFSHQTCPSDHGIARLTPLSAVSLRVHHFQNHLRSHLYYMLRWGPRESTGIRNASAGTRGARIDCFGTGSQGRRLFVTGIPGRPPVAYEQPGIRRPPQSGRGSRKDPKTTGIQGFAKFYSSTTFCSSHGRHTCVADKKKKEAVLMAVTLPPKYSTPGLLRRFRTHTLTRSACLSFRP